MNRLKDNEMSAGIKLAMILNPRIGGMEISVETVNGIVFLRGVVQDREQKNLAEDIAVKHGGIDVKNEIEVLSEVPEAKDLVFLAADDGSGDDVLRSQVSGDLESDGRVNASMINVDAAGGVIRLTGVQDNDVAKNRAEQIAWRVDGVDQVINDIEVRDRAA